MRLIADAQGRGDRGFLLGNGTGTGKTYVALGAIRQLGMPQTLVVVPNQEIIEQWRQAATAFGIPPGRVQFTTYAGLRAAPPSGAFGLTIFDEVHREATKLRQGGKTAHLVRDVAEASAFAIYATATPYEPPQDLMYLTMLTVETRRYLVRVTNSGVTAVVDPRGAVVAAAPRDTTTVVPAAITPLSTLTVATRVGDAFAWACVAVVLAALARRPSPLSSDGGMG